MCWKELNELASNTLLFLFSSLFFLPEIPNQTKEQHENLCTMPHTIQTVYGLIHTWCALEWFEARLTDVNLLFRLPPKTMSPCKNPVNKANRGEDFQLNTTIFHYRYNHQRKLLKLNDFVAFCQFTKFL